MKKITTVEEWLGKDNKLGIDIWKKKYQNEEETFCEWLDRISGNDEDVKQLILDKKFLFGGRTLSNRGTTKGSTANCYSEGMIDDSIDGIADTVKELMLSFKAQGGQGLNLSHIRPKGFPIGDAGYTSDGVIPFMEIFNSVTGGMKQGGSRKGALLCMLNARHQDIFDFISIKSKEGKIENANLSVGLDDEFMQNLDKEELDVDFTINNDKVYKYKINPKKILNEMATHMHKHGEPCQIYENRFRNYNLMEYIDDYKIDAPNACSEKPMIKYASCNLGSLNLSEYVINPFTNYCTFDFKSFEKDVKTTIKALTDVVLTHSHLHPLEEQRKIALKYLDIGLGYMGLGDMFIKMNLEYGQEKSVNLLEKIHKCMLRSALLKSNEMAKEYGTFDGYTDDILHSSFFKQHENLFTLHELEQFKQYGLRNCSVISIAPTGTLSTMLGISGGIEPIFAKSYTRKTQSLHGKDEYYTIYTPIVKEYMDKLNIKNESELPEHIITASEIYWKNRLKIQSTAQHYVDSAISSTINLPEKTTVEEIENIIIDAWELGLKGISVFRDNCDRVAVLSKGDNKNNTIETKNEFSDIPWGTTFATCDDLIGKKATINTGCGTLHIQCYFDPDTGDMTEIFLDKGSSGGCVSYMTGLSRMISLALRTGVTIEKAIDQLKSALACPSYTYRSRTKKDTEKGKSCPEAIGYVIERLQNKMYSEIKIHEEEEPIKQEDSVNNNIVLEETTRKCPECGESLQHVGGCEICMCGYSKCD